MGDPEPLSNKPPERRQSSASPKSSTPSFQQKTSSSAASSPPLPPASSGNSHQTPQPPPQQQPQQHGNSNANQQQVTVEMETVPSVPTLGVNPNSTLRVKRSQDSVPRINSAKGTSKRRSLRLAQGSKADIFAAKVANAVEEQDSSDDETFVYQAPIASSHAADTLRRPYARTTSNSSFQPPPTLASLGSGEAYLGEYSQPFDPDADYARNVKLPSRHAADLHDSQTSPTRAASLHRGNLDSAQSQHQLHASTSQSYQQPLPQLQQQAQAQAQALSSNQNQYGAQNSSYYGSQQQQQQQPSQSYQQYPAVQRVSQSSSNLQQQPSATRNFVVPKHGRAHSQSQQSTFHSQHPQHMPSSSVSSLHLPYQCDTDGNAYEDGPRDLPWQHSRHSVRSKLPNEDAVSPQKDPNDSMRAKHLYLQRWRVPASSSQVQSPYDEPSEEVLDDRASLLRGRPSLYNYQSSRNSYGRRRSNNPLALNQQILQHQHGNLASAQSNPSPSSQQGGFNHQKGQQRSGAGYISDSEYSPTDSTFTKLNSGKSWSTRVMIGASFVLIVLLSIVFVGGLLLAAGRPLHEFDVVALSDILVSDRELVFTMITHARNPGIFSRTINYGELDIFATSSHAEDTPSAAKTSVGLMDEQKKTRTVWLGTISELESPMLFRGGFSSQMQWRSASAKLVGPLGNNTALWSEISSYEFDLTVKGVLMYSVLGGQRKETVSRTYHVMSPSFEDNMHKII